MRLAPRGIVRGSPCLPRSRDAARKSARATSGGKVYDSWCSRVPAPRSAGESGCPPQRLCTTGVRRCLRQAETRLPRSRGRSSIQEVAGCCGSGDSRPRVEHPRPASDRFLFLRRPDALEDPASEIFPDVPAAGLCLGLRPAEAIRFHEWIGFESKLFRRPFLKGLTGRFRSTCGAT